MDPSTNPYAPPTADEVFATNIDGDSYRSASGLATTLQWMLGISVALAAVSAVSLGAQYELLGRMDSGGIWTGEEATANDKRVGLLAVLYGLMFLATGIVWFVWQSRTSKNARALGAEFMQFGPHAWGWFFCPIINLWRPYQVITELWRVSEPGERLQSFDPPSWFIGWWVAWLAGGVLGQVAGMLLKDQRAIDTLMTGTLVNALSEFAAITSGVIAIMLVKQIADRQVARAAKRHG